MPFPFYDQLVARAKQNKTTVDPKIWPQIAKLDQTNTELVYYVILHYARINGIHDQIPYFAKTLDGGKGVLYYVESIPQELQILLTECLHSITNST